MDIVRLERTGLKVSRICLCTMTFGISALGVREEPRRAILETMPELLRDRRLLLMLDNCEHVVEACAQLAEALLHSCPLVSVLATSRGFLQHRRRECLACPHA